MDASAMVEALVGADVDDGLLDALAGDVAAPHLLDIDVLSVLRGLVLAGKLRPDVAETALQRYFSLNIVRHDAAPLADRIWALRHQYTSYDATYLALVEGLRTALHTCDAKLDSGGHPVTVVAHPRLP